MDIVQAGNIVTTSYNTAPYLITDVFGPCACPSVLDEINGTASCSEPHFHLTLTGLVGHNKGGRYYLNGFRQDGSSVWTDCVILLAKAGEQMSFSF